MTNNKKELIRKTRREVTDLYHELDLTVFEINNLRKKRADIETTIIRKEQQLRTLLNDPYNNWNRVQTKLLYPRKD